MEKRINIAELLKDCPKGMELYSPIYGLGILTRVTDRIYVKFPKEHNEKCFKHDGKVSADGEIMLFPKGKTTWEGFQRPYKVGDKVYYGNKVCDVIEMLWNSNLNTISYGVYDGKIKNLAIAEELKSYKEEIKIDIPNGYEFFGIDDDNKIVLTKQQPQYPKTYEGCCKITRSDPAFYIDTDLYSDKLGALYKLFICRDAYWKIAGEQLGLGKPWEPDWHDDEWLDMYYISWDGKHLEKENGYPCCNIILIFPSAEMRDVFYDNFKELIEQCKELL